MEEEKTLVKRWLPVIIFAAIIFIFSAQPESGASTMNHLVINWFPQLSLEQLQNIIFYSRKIGHVIAYLLGTLLIYRAVLITPVLKKRPFLFSGILAILIAAADEYYQSTLPYRSGRLEDVFIDAIGIFIALLIGFCFQRRKQIQNVEETE